jgi:ATP-dependent DNA ligase
VAFDLLMAGGIDLRPLPLLERKAALARVGKGADCWIVLTNGVVGDGRSLYWAADLEGIVAKRLADAYRPKYAKWHKVLNRGYAERRGRAEWFNERRGHSMHSPVR